MHHSSGADLSGSGPAQSLLSYPIQESGRALTESITRLCPAPRSSMYAKLALFIFAAWAGVEVLGGWGAPCQGWASGCC